MNKKQISNFFIFLALAFSLLATAGFNNTAGRWKGGFNAYQLGSFLSQPSGFSSGQHPPITHPQAYLDQPMAVAVDSSGNYYVTDSDGSRVLKYSSAGVFIGWIGAIGQSPTGGAAGCAGASIGTTTPGWCLGGRAIYGSDDGMFGSPSGIAIDASDNIYITDPANYRVVKYTSSGVFVGWTGGISDSPTGGDPGCAGASIGTATPGWCKGGIAGGSGDGMFSWCDGIAYNKTLGEFYVFDDGDSRIMKFKSSGVFQGWIGKIASSPTGGASGCAGATVGTATPGWCTGGSSSFGKGDGMLGDTEGFLALDSAGNIYVPDQDNNRIVKYNSSGVFQGWIGKIGTSPTGGAAGCAGASVGNFTPGWCTGGFSAWGSTSGAFDYPVGVAVDLSTGDLFVTDYQGRIQKYNSSGVYQGWVGGVSTTPTGGASGCTTTQLGGYTPGWCTGGSTLYGDLDGLLMYPSGIVVDANHNVIVVDVQAPRVIKYSSAGVFQGALQSVPVFSSWNRSTNTLAYGSGDGDLSDPYDVAVDSSGNMYVADQANHRVLKYNSSGVFQGWIGTVQLPPTGGAAGCASTAIGSWTPGWCTGGESRVSSLDMKAYSLVLDGSGNIYVVDSGTNRIIKFNSSGVLQGWTGKIAASPTGGAAGCAGASVGTATPGWCTGGSSTNGTGDGMLNNPVSIAIDLSGNLYVTDVNQRISKFNSSGVFQGWIGKIATSPTGGASGCAGASANTFTSGWCKGGTSGNGTGDGMLYNPSGLMVDSSGNIYVADLSNFRISKYNSSGAFLGWVGKIGTSPTGGASGCAGAAVGSATPGWCTGGTGANGASDGQFAAPRGFALDLNGNIYVSDSILNRILKFNSSGVFQGWIGKISTSPTGGGTGCKNAAVGTIAPGWCTGGSSVSGSEPGAFGQPFGVFIDSHGDLYVAESNQSRIQRISLQGR